MNGILYYDCFAGISGDMNLAAMIDLGVEKNYLIDELKKLEVENYKIIITKDMRSGISGTHVEVKLLENQHSEIHDHEHSHSQSHNHEQRSFKDIKKLIGNSTLSDFVKSKSISIFQILAEAEGKIHNKPADDIHFHEIGATDSIIDIVGAAICIDYLKPTRIISSRIELGSGMVKCAHGLFPIPAPATAEVLKGIPVKAGLVPFEATTPTGASILAVFTDEFVEQHSFIIEKTGYGLGHKDSEVPNVLRVHWCMDNSTKFVTEPAKIIECNIDDMNPELYDYVIDLLFSEGADDVYLTPIIMKKSRPAVILSIICNTVLSDKLTEIILKETSTIGVRTYNITKHLLNRKIIEITTSLGKVKVKKSWMGNDFVKFKPEYEDCSRIAKEKKLSIFEVLKTIQIELDKLN